MADTCGEALTVGVIGGLGPAATVDLMQRVIDLTPADDDQDHIHMLVDCNPQVPSRIRALIDGTGPSPAPQLIAMARGLAAQGADFLVMPCNTAHHYYDEIAGAVDVPFLNLMELVAAGIATGDHRPGRVGLLASTALSQISLYEPYVARHGMQIAYPADPAQADLMRLITAVKAGRAGADERRALAAAAGDLLTAGADCLLLACTELSVIAAELQVSAPLFDAADILARAVVDRALAAR